MPKIPKIDLLRSTLLPALVKALKKFAPAAEKPSTSATINVDDTELMRRIIQGPGNLYTKEERCKER